MSWGNPLEGMELIPASAVLARFDAADSADHAHAWERACRALESEGLSVLPRRPPRSLEQQVLLFRAQDEPFGVVLAAARHLVEIGGRAAAEATVRAARALQVMTTEPERRFVRSTKAAAVPTEPWRALEHRIDVEGNGFLALTVAEVATYRDPASLKDGVLPQPLPDDPAAWVVLWNGINTAGFALGGVRASYGWGAEEGAFWLWNGLTTAAAAVRP